MKSILIVGTFCLVFMGAYQQQNPSAARTARQPKLSLGKPVQVGTLAVVPILSETALNRDSYITLSEAVRAGLIEIVEVPGRETVNSLEVRNKATKPLILFAGELLLGGKQDRIVGKDMIVPPRESMHVPVFCVEHGRWSGRDMSFRPASAFVPDAVRKAAYDNASQSEVWNKVAETNANARVQTGTGTIQATLNDPAIIKAVDEMTQRMKNPLNQNTRAIGMICWMDGKIYSADIFANTALFQANSEKLLRSYCLDAQLLKNPKQTRVDMRACQAFLQDILKARRELSERNAHNVILKIKDGKITGYESGTGNFGAGIGAFGGGYGHGSYSPGGSGR